MPDFHDRRTGEVTSLGHGELPLNPMDAIPHIEQLRSGLIEEGHPHPKKVHKQADNAVYWIKDANTAITQKGGPGAAGYQNSMEMAHTAVDKLNDMAYYDGADEHRELAEKIQEHISKSY